jgi:ketosteroid isomerase-like protein
MLMFGLVGLKPAYAQADSKSPVDIVRSFFDALNTKAADIMDQQLLAPNFTYTFSPGTLLEQKFDRARYLAYFTANGGSHVVINSIQQTDAQTVVADITVTEGLSLSLPHPLIFTMTFKVANGQIVSEEQVFSAQSYQDVLAYMAQSQPGMPKTGAPATAIWPVAALLAVLLLCTGLVLRLRTDIQLLSPNRPSN